MGLMDINRGLAGFHSPPSPPSAVLRFVSLYLPFCGRRFYYLLKKDLREGSTAEGCFALCLVRGKEQGGVTLKLAATSNAFLFSALLQRPRDVDGSAEARGERGEESSRVATPCTRGSSNNTETRNGGWRNGGLANLRKCICK